LLSRST
ncbi:hypothetical protein D049_3241B, partial [Vibrio parahaemolyticus VPTS-2010]